MTQNVQNLVSVEDDIAAHAVTPDEVAEKLHTSLSSGLSSIETESRLRHFGPNILTETTGQGPSRLLLHQFSSVIIWLLVAAAVIALATGNPLESAAILVVMLLNAAIGFAIEWRADRALKTLRLSTKATARVVRDGTEKMTDAATLVPGDLVVLSAGDRVPADGRVVEAVDLKANESMLTGESTPVLKDAGSVDRTALLAEQTSMVHLGTTVLTGRGRIIVTATGDDTELGSIGRMVAESEAGQTPLQRRLETLGERLVYIVLGIAGIVFLAGYLRGDEFFLMLEVALSLAVAAVPEGLPAVTTLILALGVLKMARKNAIVRRLSSVETLGSATLICTDKTGTITENRMTVTRVDLASGRTIALASDQPIADEQASALREILRVGVVCNEASIEGDPREGKYIGDPTETALLAAAVSIGLDPDEIRAEHTILSEQPFDPSTKRMIVVARDGKGQVFAALKGAPSVVVDACTKFRDETGGLKPFDQIQRKRLLETNREMAGRALRVLAFAEIVFERAVEPNEVLDTRNGYVLLGLVGMIDPPRSGVAEAVAEAEEAGIRVVMLTGDQLPTARAIAEDLGLAKEIVALHSRDLEERGNEDLLKLARTANVFARVTPEEKFRIVEVLQGAGEIVAVTGDGVNDAPALKKADIGIAMGYRGTAVAKEASDIVLTDDNFSTIVSAIEGGRTIYANIIKFVHLLFSDNLTEVLVIFIAIAAGLPLPFLPLQILWINLVTDVFPALALAVEPASPDTMRSPPRSSSENLLSGQFMVLIAWKAVVYSAIVLAVYFWALKAYGEGEHARTVTMFALIAVQVGNLFNCRSRSRSAFTRFWSNPYIFVAFGIVISLQFAATYFQPLARVLDTTVPNTTDLTVIVISFTLPIAIVEIGKFLTRRRRSYQC